MKRDAASLQEFFTGCPLHMRAHWRSYMVEKEVTDRKTMKAMRHALDCVEVAALEAIMNDFDYMPPPDWL